MSNPQSEDELITQFVDRIAALEAELKTKNAQLTALTSAASTAIAAAQSAAPKAAAAAAVTTTTNSSGGSPPTGEAAVLAYLREQDRLSGKVAPPPTAAATAPAAAAPTPTPPGGGSRPLRSRDSITQPSTATATAPAAAAAGGVKPVAAAAAAAPAPAAGSAIKEPLSPASTVSSSILSGLGIRVPTGDSDSDDGHADADDGFDSDSDFENRATFATGASSAESSPALHASDPAFVAASPFGSPPVSPMSHLRIAAAAAALGANTIPASDASSGAVGVAAAAPSSAGDQKSVVVADAGAGADAAAKPKRKRSYTSKLLFILNEIDVDKQRRRELGSRYWLAQTELVHQFERAARQVWERFVTLNMPIERRLVKWHTPLAAMLSGRYIEISATAIELHFGDRYGKHHTNAQRYSSVSGFGMGYGYTKGTLAALRERTLADSKSKGYQSKEAADEDDEIAKLLSPNGNGGGHSNAAPAASGGGNKKQNRKARRAARGGAGTVTATTDPSNERGGGPDLMSLVERVNRNRKAEAEARESKQKRDIAKQEALNNERAEVALLKLMPVLDQLNLAQAMRALAICKDNVDDAMDYVLAKSDTELLRVLGPNPVMQAKVDAQLAASQADVIRAQPASQQQQSGGVAAVPTATATPIASASAATASTTTGDTKSAPATATATATATASDKKSDTAGAVAGSGSLRTPSLQRAITDPVKTIVFKVIKFGGSGSDEKMSANSSEIGSACEVTIAPCLDRNRLPIDTDKAGSLTLSLRSLMDLKFHLPNDARIKQIKDDITNRVADIVYQVFADQSMSPLSCMPDIKLNEYEFEFLAEAKRIRSVGHRRDGPILFTASESTSANPLLNRSPIELHTEVVDSVTHNVFHLHVDDMSADVALDSVMLTGTGKSIDQCREFKKDASGRFVSYKIVVNGEKIAAVLSRHTHSVVNAAHTELRVPPVGSLLTLPGGRIARLEGIPIGLVVTSNPREIKRVPVPVPTGPSGAPAAAASTAAGATGAAANATAAAADDSSGSGGESVKIPEYALDREYACHGKHPVDLPGLLQVRILYDGKKLQPAPGRCLLIPVCRTRIASDSQLKPYNDALRAIRSGKDELLVSTLSSLEALIVADKTGGGDVEPAILNAMRVSITELLAEGEACPIGQTPAIRVRADAAFRAVRLHAISKRTGTTTAAAPAATAAEPPASPAPVSAAAAATATATATATTASADTTTVEDTAPVSAVGPTTPSTDRKVGGTTRTPATSRLLNLPLGKSPAAATASPPAPAAKK